MLYPEKITLIKEGMRVLEVGPGATPHPKADVLLEKSFSKEELLKQNGFNGELKSSKEIIYYNGGRFPFLDMEFDYVICSHVLEHIHEDDIPLFLNELSRVAPSGYIEFPTICYDWLYNFDVHKTFLKIFDETIFYIAKPDFIISQKVSDIFRQLLVYGEGGMLERYKTIFFEGIEWQNVIKYKRVNNINDLCISPDTIQRSNYSSMSFTQRFKKKIVRVLGRRIK